MSKVKIQGNASGTGIFTVAAPATNTDRTITLPDVDATVLTTAGGNVAGELTLSHADEAGLKFKSTGTDGVTAAKILFEDTAGGVGGILRFDHDDNSFKFSTAGDTERMKIDSSGRVTTPYHPCFYAYNNQSNPSIGNAYQTIVLNGTNFNIGEHFNTSTYRFTAPVTGTYLFFAKVNVYSNPGVIRAWITLNGSRRFTGPGFSGNTGGDNDTTASIVYRLNAGDYVGLDVYTGNGGNISSGETWNSLSGYLLG